MVTTQSETLRKYIRTVPDFPKKGIVFRDITTLLKDPHAFRTAVAMMTERYRDARVKKIVSVESRGFIFGSVLAYTLNAGFIPVRKLHKLPFTTFREEYQLEYGTDALEIHTDAIADGEKVLIVDDLLATGGTAQATCSLVKRLGGTICGIAFLIELMFLNGRDKLREYDIFSIIRYDAE